MTSDNDEETKRKRDFQNWAKTGIMPNSQKNDFWTPEAVFDALNERFGPFTLDAAASEENALVTSFYTMENNSLEQTWTGRIFINPPYVKQDDGTTIKDWVEKALDSVENGSAEVAVMLIPGYISNWYWHDTILPKCSHIIIFRARLDFGGPYRRAGGASRQPSVGVVFSKAWSGNGVQFLRMSNRGEWLTEEIWDREVLKIKLKNGVEAIGQILEGEKFVVLEGSTANAEPRPSFRNTDKVWRDHLIDEGALVHDGKHMRFTRDVTFNSPSLAATIVRAVSSNGRKLWQATA